MKEKPGYYAILPAEVRYDQNISSLAKLLYAEITALTEKEGYAWATNSYFASLYNVHAVTISNLISDLVKAGYIRIEIEDKVHRKIYLSSRLSENTKPLSKNAKQVQSKHYTRLSKNTDILLQESIKNNNDALVFEEPSVAENTDHRGEYSPAKERLRAVFKQSHV